MSAALLVAVGGDTQALIPLFAIGVFTGFTLAQSGLVVHWWRERPRGWKRRAAINAVGAVLTAVATIVFLAAKFVAGAWVVVVAVPAFIVLFQRIDHYYRRAAQELELGSVPGPPQARRTTVIVPIINVSNLTEQALSEALSIGDEVIAVSVQPAHLSGQDESDDAPSELQKQWERWDPGVPLQILRTEYSSVVDAIVEFIDDYQSRHGQDRQLVILIPVIVPSRLRYRFLHNHMDFVLTAALRNRTDIVIARVKAPLDAQRQPSPDSSRAGHRS